MGYRHYTEKGWLDAAQYSLNDIQRAWLNEPFVTLGEKDSQFVKVTDEQTKVTPNHLYEVPLPAPLSTKDFAQGDFTKTTDYGEKIDYENLVIVPVTDSATHRVSLLDLYLTDDDLKNTLRVPDSPYATGHWQMQLGQRTLHAVLGGQTPTLQLK